MFVIKVRVADQLEDLLCCISNTFKLAPSDGNDADTSSNYKWTTRFIFYCIQKELVLSVGLIIFTQFNLFKQVWHAYYMPGTVAGRGQYQCILFRFTVD